MDTNHSLITTGSKVRNGSFERMREEGRRGARNRRRRYYGGRHHAVILSALMACGLYAWLVTLERQHTPPPQPTRLPPMRVIETMPGTVGVDSGDVEDSMQNHGGRS